MTSPPAAQAAVAASARNKAVAAIQSNVSAANTYRAQRQQDARVRDRRYAVGKDVLYRGTTDAKDKFGARIEVAGPFRVTKVWDNGHSLGAVVSERAGGGAQSGGAQLCTVRGPCGRAGQRSQGQ